MPFPPLGEQVVLDPVEFPALAPDDVEKRLRNAQRAEGMGEARMNRARIDIVGIAKLANPPETLERPRVHHCHLELGQIDVTVDRIGDHLAGAKDRGMQTPRL